MSFRRIFVVCGLACAGVASADVKSEIQAVYTKLESAMTAKNPAGVIALCTADFKWIDQNGQSMNRAQLEQQMKMQLGAVQKIITMTNKIEKISVKGGIATTRTAGVFEATLKMTPDAKKSSTIKSVSTTDDTWAKTPKGWMLKQVRAVKEVMTLDGKPFKG